VDSFTPTSASNFNTKNQVVLQSAQYDAAGNQKVIGGYSSLYDAESRVRSSTINSVTTTFEYDGESRRVKKGSTVFAYDALGRLAAEYGGSSAGGGRQYLTTDHLGSTRVVTNANGAVVDGQRHDYLPFGESLLSGINGRTTALKYGASENLGTLTNLFTGKERDSEAKLDYFGARYFSGAQGRFTSPDEPLVDQYPSGPQSWNLYGYVRNNPLRNIDPSGRDCIYSNTFDEKAGTVIVETGFCSLNDGTYVAGTINSITYDSNSRSLDYGYTAYKTGTPSIGSTNLPNPDAGLVQLRRGTRLAEPVVNLAAVGTAAVMTGGFAGAGYGAWVGGSALTTLTIPVATLPPLVSNPTLQDIVNKLFQETDKLPGGTAGAVRYELLTGDLMSPSGHSMKAQEAIVAITNLLKRGKLSFNDQIVSRRLIQDLSDALKTKPRR